ncbi:MAG: PAS domain S-box protein [Rhizonema sp. PD38]|nr:PAS domain S-box protein [Rhizonema sp. PD38]
MHQELVTLRQRVHQLEKALSSASRSIKEQYALWINFRQTEQALRESQHQFSFLVQRHPLAVIRWNTAFEVTDWNPAAEAIFGYSRCEVLGKHGAELVPENAREQVNQILTALLGKNGGIRSTNENLTKDGKIITCQWYNIALVDLKGKVTGAISMVEDITVRKEMELALSRNEARYKKLVANIPGTIYQFRLEPDGTPSFTSGILILKKIQY